MSYKEPSETGVIFEDANVGEAQGLEHEPLLIEFQFMTFHDEVSTRLQVALYTDEEFFKPIDVNIITQKQGHVRLEAHHPDVHEMSMSRLFDVGRIGNNEIKFFSDAAEAIAQDVMGTMIQAMPESIYGGDLQGLGRNINSHSPLSSSRDEKTLKDDSTARPDV